MSRLVERERHLARLEALLDAAAAGAGGTLVVEGPAGIGKSALLAAARASAAARGVRVLDARCTELERDFPLGAARQALEPALADPAARERLLAGPARHAEQALGLPDADEVRGEGVLYGLFWLVAHLAADRPVLLVVDDAQWADEPSLRFVAYLARRAATLPVAVLVGTRPPEAPDAVLEALLADPAVERLAPTPLAVAGVATVLSQAREGPVGDAFAGACWDATGGNPFLLGELVRELVARDVPFAEASVAQVAEVTPPTVARATARTLAALGAPATALAQAACVLGDGTPVAPAAALAGVPAAEAAGVAAALVRAGLLEDVAVLRFRHPLLAGAVRASLTGPERGALHARAAALLEAEGAPADRVATQLLHAPPGGRAHAVARLREAAAVARGRGAPGTAVALLERALAEPPDDDVRAAVLLELGRVELDVGRQEAAAEHLLAAARLGADPRVRARALCRLPEASPGPPAFRALLLERVREALPDVEPVDRELALRLRAVEAMVADDAAPPDAPGDTLGEAVLLGHLVFARIGPAASAAEIGGLAARAAPHVAGLLGDDGSTVAFTGVALGLRWADRLDEAERFATRTLELAQGRGSTTGYATALTLRSAVHRRAGRLRDADADARLALAAATDDRWSAAAAAVALVACLLDRGAPEEAAALAPVAGLDRPIPDAPPLMPTLLVRMRLRGAQGDTAGALEDWTEAVRRSARLRGVSAFWMDDLAAVVDLRRVAGDTAGAQEDAARAVALGRTWGTPGTLGQALRLQARTTTAPDEAAALLREAVAHLEGSPVRLEHARALVDLGAALRRQGHRTAARDPLREGLDLARACGADGPAEHARAELQATGLKVRREALRGADALTPSERRIAALAAEGRTNAQIAQELFLTTKTVEMHLTQAYRKLDVPGRRGLAAALG